MSGSGGAAVAPERCGGCRRTIAGGTAACRAEFDAVCAFDYGGGVPWDLHRLAVDAYALQHPDEFCASGKSLAAHLAGALVGFEHDGRRAVHRALRDWLDGPRELERPDAPASRGAVTIAALSGADSPEARAEAIRRWARSAFDAWDARHALARRWLAEALSARRERC